MLRRWLALMVALALGPLAMSFSSSAGAAPSGSGRYIVVLKDRASVADLAGTASRLGATVERRFPALRTVVVSLPTGRLSALARDPRVAYVTPDRRVGLHSLDQASVAPTAPTGVTRIGAAPDNGTGTEVSPNRPEKPAAVAVVDTGISNRPDLNVAGGYDCSGAGDFSDANGHGTHVAGIIAGKGLPGVVGVSPGTPLYAVRVFDASGSGPLSNVICGLNWVSHHAAVNNIRALNLSLSEPGSDDRFCGDTNHDPLHLAVCDLTGGQVVVVTAAGDKGEDLVKAIPASYNEVVAVTAMADFDGQPGGKAPEATCGDGGRDDTAADFSNYGAAGKRDQDHVIAAPGVCITSDWNDGGTHTLSGTAMAAAHVSGLVARCYDSNRCAGKDNTQVVDKLRKDAAERPAGTGFVGDPQQPITGKYYGNLLWVRGY